MGGVSATSRPFWKIPITVSMLALSIAIFLSTSIIELDRVFLKISILLSFTIATAEALLIVGLGSASARVSACRGGRGFASLLSAPDSRATCASPLRASPTSPTRKRGTRTNNPRRLGQEVHSVAPSLLRCSPPARVGSSFHPLRNPRPSRVAHRRNVPQASHIDRRAPLVTCQTPARISQSRATEHHSKFFVQDSAKLRFHEKIFHFCNAAHLFFKSACNPRPITPNTSKLRNNIRLN